MDIPIFILCGGLGTRFREETEFKPKPMITLADGKPILWHIMKYYSSFGFKKFILCVGYKSEVIKSYFLNYYQLNYDFTINLRDNKITSNLYQRQEDWEITIAYTGEYTMTGARIFLAAKKYLGNYEDFGVTYGDGLTDANLLDEYKFHKKHGKIGTILGVNPPSRFGELRIERNKVVDFIEKPKFSDKLINGGFFFFKKDFIKYLSENENCVLERDPLVNLTNDGELMVYRHDGFWACMDTQRDREYLNNLILNKKAKWIIW